jgi:hypothetical protein
MVRGAFAKAFPSEVQPVEIAAAIQTEMEENALTLAGGTTVAPNTFLVEISPHDAKRLLAHKEVLRINLKDFATITAKDNEWTLLDAVDIELAEDADLALGIFRVTADRSSGIRQSEPLPSYQLDNPPTLLINGTSYPLSMPIVVLGRGADADIRINDPAVSRQHLRITYGQGAAFEDLETRNGTTLNGETTKAASLKDGDTLLIGSTSIIYRESEISE